MPEVQFLPSPRVNPYARENSKAFMSMMDILGKTEALRRQRSLNKSVLETIIQGQTQELRPEEIQANIAKTVVGFQPEFSSGIPGIVQNIASPFAAMTPGIDDIIAGRAIESSMRGPMETEALRADIDFKKARTKLYKTPRPVTLSPIMKMVREGLITQAEGRKLARKDADNDLGEKDIISIMHTIERALEATYDAIGSPIPGRENQRKYYIEQLEQYKSRLDEYRSTRRGETESYYSPSNPPLENLPLGTLEVNRTPPIAPRPYLNSYWGSLDDDTKSLVTRAITQGATQTEVLEALRARGAIK